MKIEGLQYQLSNGAWVDCEDRTDEFFAAILKNDYRKLTEGKAIELLKSGKELYNGTEWYSQCRIKPAHKEPVKIKEFVPDNEEWGY